MDNRTYCVDLRNGLSLDAKVLASIGTAPTMESAVKLAFSYINDDKNLDALGCKSFYSRQIIWKKNEAVGIDYGSHSRFVTITLVDSIDTE